MARNNIFGFTKTRRMTVPEGTVSGDPVRVGVVNGVALVDRADSASYLPTIDNPVQHLQNPGAWGGGNADGQATVALDGAFEFDVTSAALPEEGDQVYITAAGALDTDGTGNSKFGAVVLGAGGLAPSDNGDGTYSCTVDVLQY